MNAATSADLNQHRFVSFLRHAKSDWTKDGATDFDRLLSDRGQRDAVVMGELVSELSPKIDAVFCSAAQRTKDTLALITPFLPEGVAVHYEQSLYLANQSTLLDRVQQTDDQYRHILVIAHNPGLHNISLALVGDDQQKHKSMKKLRENFPTAALAQFSAPIEHWRAFTPQTAQLECFETPKDHRPYPE